MNQKLNVVAVIAVSILSAVAYVGIGMNGSQSITDTVAQSSGGTNEHLVDDEFVDYSSYEIVKQELSGDADLEVIPDADVLILESSYIGDKDRDVLRQFLIDQLLDHKVVIFEGTDALELEIPLPPITNVDGASTHSVYVDGNGVVQQEIIVGENGRLALEQSLNWTKKVINSDPLPKYQSQIQPDGSLSSIGKAAAYWEMVGNSFVKYALSRGSFTADYTAMRLINSGNDKSDIYVVECTQTVTTTGNNRVSEINYESKFVSGNTKLTSIYPDPTSGMNSTTNVEVTWGHSSVGDRIVNVVHNIDETKEVGSGYGAILGFRFYIDAGNLFLTNDTHKITYCEKTSSSYTNYQTFSYPIVLQFNPNSFLAMDAGGGM